MKALYPHQEEVIEKLRDGHRQGHRRQLLAMPTGAGKTVVASHLIRSAHLRGHRSMFVVDRIELVGQAAAHLENLGLNVGILQGENTSVSAFDDAVVASIQTLRTRTNWCLETPDLVVVDEAHILHKAHVHIMEKWSNIPFIGLSATPLRKDLGKYFSNLVRGPSIAWLMEHGFLTPARAFCPTEEAIAAALEGVKIRRGDFVEGELGDAMNSKELVGDIVSTWQRLGENRQTLCFAVNIAHSKAIAEEFQMAGVFVAHLDAYTPAEERRELIGAFRAGEIRILTSVNVLGIGFDVPSASCGILARPTVSEALHIQQVGRLIRACEGKSDAILLDHAGNTLRFGLPQDFVVPDLNSRDRQTAATKRNERKMATCSDCGFVLEPGRMICPNCGIDRKARASSVSYVDGELIEYGSGARGKVTHTAANKREWYQGLRWHAEMKGHSDGWAYHKFIAKFGTKPPWSWRTLEPVPPTPEVSRWIRSQQIRWAKSKQRQAGYASG